MITDTSAREAMRQRNLNKCVEMLLGLVTGMLADGHLNDAEVKFLNTWLTEHADVAEVWPGSVVAKLVREILADGVISGAEHDHLVRTLTDLAGNDFAQTGSVSAEVMSLPLDEHCPVDFRDANVCLTGEFLFGTRNKCEALAAQAGATPASTVTRRIAYLIVGTKVSPNWAHTSYGRKIEQAVELQQSGHHIKIISEKRWLTALA